MPERGPTSGVKSDETAMARMPNSTMTAIPDSKTLSSLRRRASSGSVEEMSNSPLISFIVCFLGTKETIARDGFQSKPVGLVKICQVGGGACGISGVRCSPVEGFQETEFLLRVGVMANDQRFLCRELMRPGWPSGRLHRAHI